VISVACAASNSQILEQSRRNWPLLVVDRILPVHRQDKENSTMDDLKPTAAALPRRGEKLVKGRYGSMMPVTPANGFTLIARVKPGCAPTIRAYGQKIEDTIRESPEALAVLRLRENPAAFAEFCRAHQAPSFMKYAQYPDISATEVVKAVTMKRALSEALDQLQ
jgi:hypothetical protein